ncbi:DUF7305 domain-containing protein [Bacillus sp. FJAT-45037]|uniref:DUF7305 domain-containing protein n=1 Tax=Bacillus sp. FJAT-45037 TaxID=2011007 RepID=UPI000C23C06B|nr:prepilin-type N-terminal cleavage/methylation domain-containing protein [Bacillus sp. FJAT-45037]
MYKKITSNQSGLTLIEVLITLLLVSLIGGISFSLLLMTTGHNDRTQSHINLRQEANLIVTTLRQQHHGEEYQVCFNDLLPRSQIEFDDITLVNNSVTISDCDMVDPTYHLQVNFTLSDSINTTFDVNTIIEAERTHEREKITIEIREDPRGGFTFPSNYALFANEYITLSGGATINGDIGTSYLESHIQVLGGAAINGNILDQQHKITQIPIFPTIPSLPVYPDAEVAVSQWNKHNVVKDGNLNINSWMAKDYTLNLDGNYSFKDINVTSNYKLKINTGEQDRILVVDHLNNTNGHIEVIGSGKLTIYVRDKITMGSGSTINNNGSIDRLNVYLEGNKSGGLPKNLKLSGSQKIYGSLFAEDANIEITAGGGFQGAIVTGGNQVKVDGGTRNNSLIYAPNATFTLSGGGIVNGMVISNRFSGDGGTRINYQPIDVESVPFFN